MMRFSRGYFILSISILVTEILIATFLHDPVVRPYLGDFLVVIFIYCFLQSLLLLPVMPLAFSVLIFSFLVEISQYFKLINCLGLQHSMVAKLILGTSFSWLDMLAYTSGVALVIIVEKVRSSN